MDSNGESYTQLIAYTKTAIEKMEKLEDLIHLN
jgi:hypothetical protein